MSHYIYIANKKNKTLFNLGKSGLRELMDEPEALLDQEYLTIFIKDDCHIYLGDCNDDEKAGWIQSQSEYLFEFAKDTEVKDLVFFSDSTDEYYYAGCLNYRLAGSIYGAEDIESSNKRFAENWNEHHDRYNPSRVHSSSILL